MSASPRLMKRIVGAAVVAALIGVAPTLYARTLEQVKYKGAISVCANPDALPYASAKAEPPGFQIEIARALAKELGLSLDTQWIAPRYRANLVNCDIMMDSINDPSLYEGKLLLSRPYQASGIALGLSPKAQDVKALDDLKPGQKVGVMINSMASVVFGKRGISTSPYAFEPDMLEDLVKGELYGAAVAPAILSYYLKNHPDSGLRILQPQEVQSELSWTVSVGMRKSDQALVDAVNRALEKLLDDGTIAAIYGRYGVTHRRP